MPAGTSPIEQLLTTRAQLDQHFKSVGLRDAEFRRQKLVLQERSLKQARKDRNALEAMEQGVEERLRGRAARPEPGASPHRGHIGQRQLHSTSMPDLSLLPGMCMRGMNEPGLSRTRFSASVPVSHHPACHPGALTGKMLLDSAPEFRASPSRPPAGRFANTAAIVRTPSSPGGGSPVVREASNMRTMPTASRWSPSGCPQGLGIGEDPLWITGLSQEELLFHGGDDDDFVDSGGLRPQEPKLVLKRFGEYIHLLGPRYKTLPHGVIWDRAVLEGTTSALERRMMRSLQPPPAMPAKKRVPPEDVPNMDTEHETRASWVATRRLQRLQRERQQQQSQAVPVAG